jgi:predicted  nucleic acid-binding Zn-ribbon protein
MPPVTDIFRECHRLRVHLRNLTREIELGPRVLKGKQEELEEERQAHKEHHDSITRFKLKQREDEGSLKQTDTRLAKLGEQLLGTSVQKEYEAKQHEIAHAKAKKAELEDAILNSMTEIDERTAAIPAVEKRWADAQAAFAEFQKQAAERLEMLKGDKIASEALLAKTEEGIPEDIRPRYEKFVKVHGPEAMAAVKGKSCQGCRTDMTDQKLIELRRGEFMQCPTCGKILFPAE